jgi:hypothetical protein
MAHCEYMNSRKIYRYGLAVACLAMILLSYTNCTPSGFGSTNPNMVAAQSTLAISPTQGSIAVNGALPFTATGGVPPYTYRVSSGSGTINPVGGTFVAPATPEAAWVSVTDSVGASVAASITIGTQVPVSSAPPTGGDGGGMTGSTGPSDCTAMIYDEYVFATDGSAGGFSYATAVSSIGDPSTCATFCNSESAGYCEWIPAGTNGFGASTCVAWPAGLAMATTTGVSASYAGSCVCDTSDPTSTCYTGTSGGGPVISQ